MWIMEGNDYHYSVLGLDPGATDREIRAAYRRLIKIYHPDRDSSLDAEMRYREIQDAYSALRGKKVAANDGRPREEKKRKTTENSGPRGRSDTEYDVNSGLGDFLINDEVQFSPRIPFSWGKLRTILRDSLKESIAFGLVVRTCLCVRMLWILFRTPVFPQLLGIVTIPSLLVGCLIFRYYNVKSARRKIFFIASAAGAFVASLCYMWFTFSQSRKLGVEKVFFVTLGSLLVLWVKVNVKPKFLAMLLRTRMRH
jgi:hypothetical protein